jgi:hypothetical protein
VLAKVGASAFVPIRPVLFTTSLPALKFVDWPLSASTPRELLFESDIVRHDREV